MSCFAIAYWRTVAAAIPLTVLLGLAGTTLPDSAARAAEARPAAAAAPARCGELPRGSRAYKDCITAQARRDTKPDTQAPIKPVFSSR